MVVQEFVQTERLPFRLSLPVAAVKEPGDADKVTWIFHRTDVHARGTLNERLDPVTVVDYDTIIAKPHVSVTVELHVPQGVRISIALAL